MPREPLSERQVYAIVWVGVLAVCAWVILLTAVAYRCYTGTF